MKRIIEITITTVILAILIGLTGLAFGQVNSKIGHDHVLQAMRKATDFMALEVSNKGGYLHYYSEDFTEQWGEGTARKSQVWVQECTHEMGHLFLDMYHATGDEAYLNYAKKVADVLIYGQHPLGGWHYFIDFDPAGTQEWYEEIASNYAAGYEEFRHYYGNCTYDDNVTQGATAYLLRIYGETLSPEYLGSLKKALDFILISQYPNGGWPQRYPLEYKFVHEGIPDYTSMYTLNDDAMTNTINVLLDAYEFFGDERYLEAARRGGDFLIIAQGPEGHEGWSEQYNMNLQPCWARTHEPPGFMVRQTIHSISTLEQLFLYTGDRRYLRPIPAAIKWMENSCLGKLDNGMYEFSRIYDPKTNLPVNTERVDGLTREGYIRYHHFPDKNKPFDGPCTSHDLEKVIAQYDLVSNCAKGEESILYAKLFKPDNAGQLDVSENEIASVIEDMNEKGTWNETIRVWNSVPGRMTPTHTSEGWKRIQGISHRTYMKNMRMFLSFLKES